MKAILLYIILMVTYSHSISASDDLEVQEIMITLKDHKFEPNIIKILEGQKIRLTIFNKDKTIEEFDSVDLKREKIIPAGGHIHIVLAPLKAGRYEFMGEFHHETAKGAILVEELSSKESG